jgi:hypothetical protein
MIPLLFPKSSKTANSAVILHAKVSNVHKTRMNTTKRLSSTVLLLLMCSCASNAFYINTPAFATRRIHNSRQSLELSMIEDSLVQSFDFKILELQQDALSTTSHSLMTPEVEAEVLTDMSHVMMDFSGFLPIGTPSKSMLRYFSVVVGRILVLSADYLPDHTVHPEELVVQLFLLTVSLSDILKARHMQEQASMK